MFNVSLKAMDKKLRENVSYIILQSSGDLGGRREAFVPRKRVSDFENQISRIISECGQFLSLLVRVTSCDGQLYCI